MAHIDDIASIAATKHCRTSVVTASTDSVDFLHPIRPTDAVFMESFVTWTGRTSLEVFTKVIKEDLLSGERSMAATSFLTFVAIDEQNKPTTVAPIIPETEEEVKLHETAPQRAEVRRIRREESRKLAGFLTMKQPWE